MASKMNYCCPAPECARGALAEEADGLRGPCGHFYPYAPGTAVPVFASEAPGANEYAIQDAAAVHDNALRWVLKTFDITEDDLRTNLVRRLRLKRGQRVLVTGAGAGNDISYLVDALEDEGEIYAQDIALPMLLEGIERNKDRLARSHVTVHYSASDATNLPFAGRIFDAAYHMGGINLFPDIRAGIVEMDRLVKPGGQVVICDEAVAPWLKTTEYGRALVSNNALYALDIPLHLLPETARNVNVSWEVGNCFYVIDYTVSDQPLPLDIDVPHVGTRGGSIRKRHYGRLEGVDPALRDKVYEEAKRQGVSRVEFIERLLSAGVKG